MKVDKALISKLEKLARLKLSTEEQTELMTDLNKILGMVEKMEEIDTSAVEPLVYVSEEVNVLREDEVKHQVDRQAALDRAPDQDGTYFKLPKVIDL